jgi:uncharacterized membrane protein
MAFSFPVSLVFFLPMLLDGGRQVLGGLSTNRLRLVTGTLAGLGGVFALLSMIVLV